MDPLTSALQRPAQPAATRPTLTVESFDRSTIGFDGSGQPTDLDLAMGVTSSVQVDDSTRATLTATMYEVSLSDRGPSSLALPSVGGEVTRSVGDTTYGVHAHIGGKTLTTPGFFAEQEPNGTHRYSVEFLGLGATVESPRPIAALEVGAELTESAYDAIGDGFVMAYDSMREVIDRAWNWATGASPPSHTTSSPSAQAPSAPINTDEVLREARFTSAFAELAYNDPAALSAQRGDWRHEDITSLVDTSDGFSASVFHTRKEGRDTVVVAYRGTNEARDWLTNIEHLLRLPSQYVQGVNVAMAIKAKYPEKDIILTGHSLGGGIASFAALMTGVRAYAFNAAGPQEPSTAALPQNVDRGLVRHINTESDPLTSVAEWFAGRPWGGIRCTPDESTRPFAPNEPEFRNNVRHRTIAIADYLAQHEARSLSARLGEPGATLLCERVS